MMEISFFIPLFLAALLISIMCGTVGCFVVWRSMGYFGESLAHSTLMGVALGFALNIDVRFPILGVAILFSCLLFFLEHRGFLKLDSILGILAHACLSCGMIILSLIKQPIDLHSYLFGDILLLTSSDLLWIALITLLVIGSIYFLWSDLLLMTFNTELAYSEGVKVPFIKLVFMCSIAMMVAVSVQIIGILLMSSLLIIPAAAARQFSKSPEWMVFFSIIISFFSFIMGIWGSFEYDLPVSPLIVLCCTSIFSIIIIQRLISDH